MTLSPSMRLCTFSSVGTGVGFSVERQFISKLPEVPELFESESIVVVKDSKEGWAKGFRQVLALLWAGEIPKWDVSQVRPAGARLKTFGGRAVGPAPLVELFNFAVATFKAAQGRKLTLWNVTTDVLHWSDRCRRWCETLL